MTLTTHFIAVEADRQIDQTGPIKESMASWIERSCGDVTEVTKRRRICNYSEETAIYSYILSQKISLIEDDLAFIPWFHFFLFSFEDIY